MKATKDTVFFVNDHGLYVSFALRLAQEAKHVYYATPHERGFPLFSECSVGDGFQDSNVTWVEDFWQVKSKVDVACFPDIQGSGLQLELEAQGFPVWGARKADRLELDRELFLRTLKQLNLEVPPHHICQGWTELCSYLADQEDCYIKISYYRGTSETRHWINARLSQGILDEYAIKFGGLREHVRFVVCQKIDAQVEWGYDGYCVLGRFPAESIHGPEVKDQCYIASRVAYDDLPDPVREVNDAFAPVLAKANARCFWSTELRICEDGTAYFIDPTPRVPSPAGEAQMLAYANFPDIINAGAHGECLDPEFAYDFVVEVLFEHDEDHDQWRTLDIPEAERPWVQLYNVCQADGLYHFPPLNSTGNTVGAVLGGGRTLKAALESCKSHIDAISHNPIKANTHALVDALKEIHEADEQGVELTDQPVPEPEEAV